MTPEIIQRRYMLGSCSRCIHSVLERIVPRWYQGLPAYWCHGEIQDCQYRRTNLKGEGICTKTCRKWRRT